MIVCTHFLPPELLSGLARKRKLKPPFVTVVTDFDAHALWVSPSSQRYFIAGPDARRSLAHWGVSDELMHATGIPIDPIFTQSKSAKLCREKHALSPDKPCVLLLSGGCGVGPIEAITRAILTLKRPLQLIVVCGKNAKLKSKLDAIKPPTSHALKVMGFTTEIDELMRASDVVITKPGGLTTSEVLASGSAMLIINPIPGQESRNADMLLECGAALKASSVAAVRDKLDDLLADPERLSRLRTNARALGKPNSAFDVATQVLEMIDYPAAAVR
jgi:processive 1,2-diacylglycerol beta-glucosyltransferase